MNATFSVAYSFEVDREGRPTSIRMMRDDFLEPTSVPECVEDWRLPEVEPGSEILVTARWEHGVGWTQLSIVGETIRQRIVRSGDLNPYSPTQDSPGSNQPSDERE
ncbi:MAG: hypothetical protein GY722_28270 [bacterium]|nr:hypothetical protein [bacterium]